MLFPSTRYILEYLTYDFPRQGLLGVVYPEFLNTSDTIRGTFEEMFASGDTIIRMRYDNRTIDYLYKANTAKSPKNINLIEDLTGAYQDQYPDQGVNKVYAVTPIYIIRRN